MTTYDKFDVNAPGRRRQSPLEIRPVLIDGTIYLDYQAATPLDPRVAGVMQRSVERDFANPSSDDHSLGWRARQAVDEARSRIACAFGASDDEIVFTSGATEANNLAVLGAARAAPVGRRRVLVSAIEHKSVLEAAAALRREGFTVEYAPTKRNGQVDLEALHRQLHDDVAVVSVMAINNETGVLQPVEAVAAIAHAVGAFVHCDATQAPLAMDLDLTSLDVDAASLSSHKIYGPKGVGALFLSAARLWSPASLVHGGGQEGGLRSGTLPTFLCVGFAEAADIVSHDGAEERSRVGALRDRLVGRLRSEAGGVPTIEGASLHPGAAHTRFPDHDAADLLGRLQPKLAASLSSACTSGVIGASHVLTAMGLSEREAKSCIRLSLGRFTTDEQIDRAVDLIQSAIADIGRRV